VTRDTRSGGGLRAAPSIPHKEFEYIVEQSLRSHPWVRAQMEEVPSIAAAARIAETAPAGIATPRNALSVATRSLTSTTVAGVPIRSSRADAASPSPGRRPLERSPAPSPSTARRTASRIVAPGGRVRAPSPRAGELVLMDWSQLKALLDARCVPCPPAQSIR